MPDGAVHDSSTAQARHGGEPLARVDLHARWKRFPGRLPIGPAPDHVGGVMSILTRLPREVYDRNLSVFDDFDTGTRFRRGTARGMAWLSQLAYETETDGKI